MREQAAKSAQDRQARLYALSPADRRRAFRHGLDRAERNAEQRRTTAENTQEPIRPVPRNRAARLQARADRASTKPTPPLPSDRERGKIYITGHKVFGVGPIHTAIEYTPIDPDPKAKHETKIFSAGPKWRNGKMDNYRRPTDEPANNDILGTVELPANVTPEAYIKSLDQADDAYCDCVDYDFFPEWSDSHNSNSYTRGILEATGGKANIKWNEFVGGGKPVPPRYFRKQTK